MFSRPEDGEILRCKRFPPVMFPEGQNFSWKHPWVNPNSYCGEYLPANNLDGIEWVTWKKGLLEDGQVQK